MEIPVDLVLLGMIAAFLVLRLRSILGQRRGFEPAPPFGRPAATAKATAPVIDGKAERAVATPARPMPAESSPAGQALAAIRAKDKRFDAAGFVSGAENAFRLIVSAFAAGERARLKPLLTDQTYHDFVAAIDAREAAGETQRTEIRAIEAASIEEARLTGSQAAITVRFVSMQINLTSARDGTPVAGTDAVTELADIWTFERDLNRPDPAWRLAAARSA